MCKPAINDKDICIEKPSILCKNLGINYCKDLKSATCYDLLEIPSNNVCLINDNSKNNCLVLS